MKFIVLLAPILCFFTFVQNTPAATNVVIQGDSLQQAIDTASSGDTLVVQGGAYTGNLNVTKPLVMVCSGTNAIQLPGNVNIQAPAGSVSICQAIFLGSLTINTNSTLMLYKCTCSSSLTSSGGNLQAFDDQFSGALTATGGKLLLKRCTCSADISLNGTALEAMRLTGGNLSASADPASGLRCLLVQSSVSGTLSISGYQGWIGYNTITRGYFYGCATIAVGNYFNNYGNDGANGLYTEGGNLTAYNNRINKYNTWYNGTPPAAVRLNGTQAKLVNNAIAAFAYSSRNWSDYDGWHYDHVYPIGIQVSGAGTTTIRNCAVRASWDGAGYSYGITADAGQISDLSYCCISASAPLSGVSSATTFFADPGYNSDLTIAPGSACKDAGAPDPIYNDSDGSRNDIGCTGGTLWNPSYYTNNNPMVFWLMPTNQTVLKGQQTSIPVTAAATAGH